MVKKSLVVAAGIALLGGSTATVAQDRMERFRIARACAGDIERLCYGVPPGEGRIKACMRAHMRELSAPCFDAILGAIAAEKEP
jgi:hypothetical protein